MKAHGNDLYLTGSCDDPKTQFRHTAGKSLLHTSSGKCIHPYNRDKGRMEGCVVGYM